jgi:hypothetical protein
MAAYSEQRLGFNVAIGSLKSRRRQASAVDDRLIAIDRIRACSR